MNNISDLEREILHSVELIEKANRLAASQKNEDGSRKPTTKKPRKKQKLSPEQKKNQKQEQKLVKKVKNKLKDKKYKSRQTGEDLSFNTALNRRHPKAQTDFNRAMDKARGDSDSSKSDGESKGGLSSAQKDIVNRVISGNRKFDDLSVVEEESLKDALSLLGDIGLALGIEFGEVEGEVENEEVQKAIKKRKPRSDKGKKRDSYKKRVKKEVLDEMLPDEVKDQVDTESLSDLTEDEVSDTSKVLEDRSKERETRSDKGKKRTKKKKPNESDKAINEEPIKIEDTVKGQPLFSQPPHVQKEVIKETLGKVIKDTLQTGKGLSSLEKDTKSIQEQINSSIEALDDLNEGQLESLSESYEKGSKEVVDILSTGGMDSLREWATKQLDTTPSPNPPATLEELNNQLSDPKNKKKKKEIEDQIKDLPNAQKEYASQVGKYLSIKNTIDGVLNDPEFGVRDYPSSGDEIDEGEHEQMVRKEKIKQFNTMEKKQRDEYQGFIGNRIQELESKLDDDSLSDEDKSKIEGRLKNVKTTQSALNTVKMKNGEGVIEGYHEVPNNLLEIARSSESDAWDDAITELSTKGSSPEKAKEHMRNVIPDLDTEGFSAVMGGAQGDFGSILETMEEGFCPASPTNNSKGVGGKKVTQGETCPNPMPDDVRQMLKEYMSDSFVNTMTVEKDSYRDTPKSDKQDKTIKKQKQEAKQFWKNNKDRFFQNFIDGVDNQGNPISEEEKVAYAEIFRTEWFESDMKHRVRGGVKIYDNSPRKYDFNQLMEELKKARSIKGPLVKSEKLKGIREKLQSIFDQDTTDTTKKASNIFNKPFIGSCYRSGGSKSMLKKSSQYVDYQERSRAFELGMRVYPFLGGNPARSGLVIAIFPAIGMVDVQFPHGASRFPVEDLVVDTSGDYRNIYSDDTIPGGLGTVPVSSKEVKKKANRVASRYIKNAIYWYKKDRTYRQCKNEEKPCCPKCKTPLGKTVYKRRDGHSEKLLACYTCLFIIKPSDIIGG